MDIPAVLAREFGHADFGVYATMSSGGTLAVGDALHSVSCATPFTTRSASIPKQQKIHRHPDADRDHRATDQSPSGTRKKLMAAEITPRPNRNDCD